NVHEVTASSAGGSWRKKSPTSARLAAAAVHPLGTCRGPAPALATRAYRRSPAPHDPRAIVSPAIASCSSTVAASRLLHRLPHGRDELAGGLPLHVVKPVDRRVEPSVEVARHPAELIPSRPLRLLRAV